MENYKELLTALYKEHAPEKIDQIDFYLERYKGKEKQYYITQKAKYANKRSVTDSKKILEEAIARIAKQKKAKVEKSTSEKMVKKEEDNHATKSTIKKPEEILPVKEAIKETVAKENTIISEEKKQKESPIVDEIIRKAQIVAEEKEIKLKEEESIPSHPEIVDSTELLEKSIKLESAQESEKKEEFVTSSTTKSTEPKKVLFADEKELKEEEKKIEASSRREQELADYKEAKEKLATSKKKEKKKISLVWYFGGAAVLVLFVAIFVYFAHFYQSESHHEDTLKVEHIVLENQKVNSNDLKNNQEKVNEEAIKDQDNNHIEKPKVQEVSKEKPKEIAAEKTNNTALSTQSTADRLYARDFQHPAIFVACFAVKSEKLAQEKVSMLQSKDLRGHYYWIQDMDKNGAAYFKVVVGPFQTARESYPSLTKVQERINFDAYLITIK